MQRDEAEDRADDGTVAKQGRAGEADDQPNDSDLVQRLRDGDGDALRQLMGRYDRLVRYVVFRLCRAECTRDPAFLDSRASEAWTGFVRSVQRPGAQFHKNLKPYLIQITKNKCADAMRRPEEGTEGGAGQGGDELAAIEAPAPASVELLIQAEEVLALRECVETLSSSEKKLYNQVEHLVAGRWTLVAQALNMPESTVRTRWSALMAKLKACLQKKASEKSAPRPPPRDS